jgi:molybdenum-dependent DNA-binding transcriptional regulator ModE
MITGRPLGKVLTIYRSGVEETNSLHEAAHRMNMSYGKAEKLIQTIEKIWIFRFR